MTIGDVPEAALYVRNRARVAARAGIQFEERNFSASVSTEEITAAINACNTDPRVTGMILQRPVPDHFNMRARSADAVFVPIGKPKLVTADMIKPGAARIDINQVETDGEIKTVGDVDFDACLDTAGWITPVPGGVGPVTVAILTRNALVAARAQKSHYDTGFSTL